MRRSTLFIVGAALLGILQTPAIGQEKKAETKAPPAAKQKELPKALPCCPPGYTFRHMDRPVVFVANGAGGSTTLSDNLLELNGDMHLRLRIQMVPWARRNSLYEDLTDSEAQLNAASRIACTVLAMRKDCPNLPIFLVGQSAGARVVLAAAEMLPEKSVDRVIILAPAVSCSYDLGNALKASSGGIDSFYSTEDGVLETAAEKSYLADGLPGPAAGRVGFRLPVDNKNDMLLYRNLRQYRWTDAYHGSGGHFAWSNQHNLKKAVVPLLFAGNIIIEPLPPAAAARKMPAAK